MHRRQVGSNTHNKKDTTSAPASHCRSSPLRRRPLLVAAGVATLRPILEAGEVAGVLPHQGLRPGHRRRPSDLPRRRWRCRTSGREMTPTPARGRHRSPSSGIPLWRARPAPMPPTSLPSATRRRRRGGGADRRRAMLRCRSVAGRQAARCARRSRASTRMRSHRGRAAVLNGNRRLYRT